MLSNMPPGYQAPSTNRQTIGGLSVPGNQANATTLGKLAPIGLQQPTASPTIQGSSSYLPPSSQIQPPTMTPYFKSGNGNLSTLLRVLTGKH